MKESGTLLKMESVYGNPIRYNLPIGKLLIPLNEFIGKNISLKYENEIYCIACGSKTHKSFAQGLCYSCFISSPQASECILHPELCRAHEGKGRDLEFERRNHLQEHFVYLALSSDIKVGVTRSTQVPTRWIDQGASFAIPIAKVPYRYLAGVIEVGLKKYLTDKTNWQRMLKNEIKNGVDLVSEKGRVLNLLPEELRQYSLTDNVITEMQYPVLKFPHKVKSIDLEKQKELVGKLTGIKGQYLMMEDGSVINIRKYGGYLMTVEA